MERIVYRARRQRRKEPRFAANIESVLAWDGLKEPVFIKNISTYGALLEGRYFPPVNTRVTLIADGLEISGTIIWLGLDRCGLLLGSPVEPLAIVRDRPVRTVESASLQAITLRQISPRTYA